MSILETISMMSKRGYTDKELLEYIDKHYDEIECELSGEVHEEPKKRDRYFCMGCKLRKIAPNVEYLSTILPMCHHTIIRCNLREGNSSTRDMTILRSY